ncbi:MAG TPA: glycosyltransferase family 4 protein [Blastocatellia bacterium]|nr:glycosyltransferase family 4 protein [Blastocatellia bacterium]
MLTSSFPRDPLDETCGYIREFARELGKEFDVTVLAPPDPSGGDWPKDRFTLKRSPSAIPARMSLFQASLDMNEISRAGLLKKLASAVSIALFAMAALRCARKADVICSHWMLPSGLAGALASLLLLKPHIVVEHSGAIHLLERKRCGRSLSRFIVDHSHRVICVSSHLKRKLISLYAGAEPKTEVIPMGVRVNAAPLRDRNDETKTALFLGRLTEIKGVELLLQAIRDMRGVELLVAGEGERRRKLEALAAGLAAKTTFLGQVDAAGREALLARCDFVVIPSMVLPDGRTEGTPVVCLESLAAGRPVIASRAGGLAEIIEDGYNGLLFDPGDSEALASAIRKLIEAPELGEYLSRNARLSSREYDWGAIGERFRRAIRSALE